MNIENKSRMEKLPPGTPRTMAELQSLEYRLAEAERICKEASRKLIGIGVHSFMILSTPNDGNSSACIAAGGLHPTLPAATVFGELIKHAEAELSKDEGPMEGTVH